MTAWIRITAVGLSLAFPAGGSAHWLRPRPVAVAGYYYPPPVPLVAAYRPVYYLAPAAALPSCGPAASLAVPFAAPSSGTPRIPRVKETQTREPPRVTNSHYHPSEEPPTQEAARAEGASPCWMGFWNESDRALTLTVDGQSQPLAPGRHIIMKVNRQFAWQVSGQKLRLERVPPDRIIGVVVIPR